LWVGSVRAEEIRYTETKTFEHKYWTGKKKGEKSIKIRMARKGNPISVRLDLNRSSDSSWFSEGDRERKVTEWVSLFLQFVPDLK
jgi:hypothetical protein